MKGMEWQVTNLELSKKIKELGFPQDTEFYWERSIFHKDNNKYILTHKDNIYGDCKRYSAPTVAEWGEILKRKINPGYNELTNQWQSSVLFDKKIGKVYIQGKTEANARTEVWIYLKQNKLI